MKRIIILLCLLGSLSGAQEKVKVAVMDLKAQEGVSQQVTASLTDLMTTELAKIESLSVINRDDMQAMLTHIADKQLLGCDDTKCLVKIGGALGVKYLVTGNVGQVGTQFLVNLKLIDIDDAFVVNRITEKDIKSETALIPVLERSVYALMGSKRTSIYAEEGIGGDLYIKTSIPGAQVLIDGIEMEGTPPMVLEKFAVGGHLIEARKDDYYGSVQINLAEGDLQKIMVQMSRAQGALKVFSKPAEAQVIIGNAPVGTTPAKIDGLPARTTMVTIRKAGYLDYTGQVDIVTGGIAKMEVDLVPAAFLTISGTPTKAAILVNGRLAGYGEIRDFPVAAGDVSVEVKRDNYESYQIGLKLAREERNTLKYELVYKFGVLRISSLPSGANVYLNDTKAGTTAFVDNARAPGTYRLKVVKPSYQDILKNITVEKNTHNDFNFTLQHTKAYLDSVEHARTAFKRQRQKIQKIAFASLSLVFSGLAVYMDMKAVEQLDKQDEIYADYQAGVFGSDFEAYKRAYNDAGADADAYIGSRNLFWGLTGGSSLIFGMAFAF